MMIVSCPAVPTKPLESEMFAIQAKLLRFIQDKEHERLGETLSRKANGR